MTVTVEEPTRIPALKKKNVAAYARVSVDTEETDRSLTNQVEYYKAYINSRPDWRFAGVYADEGLTGTKADRPGFQKLLKSCEDGMIDLILTKSISRFARNTVDLLNTTRHLKSLGINIWFERENLNSISPEGELMLTLLASFAQEEARSVSENMKWSIQKRFERGISTCFFMFGYKWDGSVLQIVEDQAETVRWIYNSYLKGMSPNRIADSLKARGIKPGKGGDFCYNSVCNILRNEKYTGDSLLMKSYREDFLTKKRLTNHGEKQKYYVTESHPAIISHELFNAVQEELARRREIGYQANQRLSFSCFSGNVYCGKCGRTYRRRIPKKGYYRWTCGTRIAGTSEVCGSQNIPEKALYALTSEVLETEELTKELFDRSIDRIVVSGHSTLEFQMRDGSVIHKHWLVTTTNPKQKEEINGKIGYPDPSNQE